MLVFRANDSHRSLNTTVVFRVPHAIGVATTPQQYKEYRIETSHLRPSYLEEQVQGSASSSKDTPPAMEPKDTTVEQFDAYMDYLAKSDVLKPFEKAHCNDFILTKSIGKLLGSRKTKPTPNYTDEQARKEYMHLLGCYTLGTTMHDHRFEDVIASRLLNMLRQAGSHQSQFIRLLSSSGVQSILDRYATNAPLFTVVVKAYARFATLNDIDKLASTKYPGAFRIHVMKELARLRTTQHFDGAAAGDFAMEDCNYHNHSPYDFCPVRPKKKGTAEKRSQGS